MNPAVTVHTLGCKLNQVESEGILAAFREFGQIEAAMDGGVSNALGGVCASRKLRAEKMAGTPFFQLHIVNTCTVTSKAEQKARRLIRRLLRGDPAAVVIVTGCYAQLNRADIEALDDGAACSGPRRLFVAGGVQKAALLRLPEYLHDAAAAADAAIASPDAATVSLRELTAAWFGESAAGGAAPSDFDFAPQSFAFHSRPSLKIQDGCDNRCAFCRVSIARGPSRSLGADEVLRRLRRLEEDGKAEAVLTGVNIGQYRDGGSGLAGLLRHLLGGTERIALRLSSLEPMEISGELLAAVACERVRPHFHLSLQSASDAVLRRMGRRCTAAQAEETLALLRRAKGDPFLACDIICGFPGETEADFDATYEFCRRAGFAWIHAFPFSPRPGTAAISFGGRVSESAAVKRVDALADLARRGRAAYVARWLGREAEAVTEGSGGSAFAATTENYLKVKITNAPGAAPPPGRRIRVRLQPLPPTEEAAYKPGGFDAAGTLC